MTQVQSRIGTPRLRSVDVESAQLDSTDCTRESKRLMTSLVFDDKGRYPRLVKRVTRVYARLDPY